MEASIASGRKRGAQKYSHFRVVACSTVRYHLHPNNRALFFSLAINVCFLIDETKVSGRVRQLNTHHVLHSSHDSLFLAPICSKLYAHFPDIERTTCFFFSRRTFRNMWMNRPHRLTTVAGWDWPLLPTTREEKAPVWQWLARRIVERTPTRSVYLGNGGSPVAVARRCA